MKVKNQLLLVGLSLIVLVPLVQTVLYFFSFISSFVLSSILGGLILYIFNDRL